MHSLMPILAYFGAFIMGFVVGWNLFLHKLKLTAPDFYRSLKAQEVDEDLAVLAERNAGQPSLRRAWLTIAHHVYLSITD
jgi:hypothetical protein